MRFAFQMQINCCYWVSGDINSESEGESLAGQASIKDACRKGVRGKACWLPCARTPPVHCHATPRHATPRHATPRQAYRNRPASCACGLRQCSHLPSLSAASPSPRPWPCLAARLECDCGSKFTERGVGSEPFSIPYRPLHYRPGSSLVRRRRLSSGASL